MTTTSAIPALSELQQVPQWVCWSYEERGGKQTKVPYTACTGYKASTIEPKTWCTYDLAIKGLHNIKNKDSGESFDGIGFVFNDDYTGIDWDHCIQEDGTIDEWALEWVNRIKSYIELSPSKTGLHGIARGVLPGSLDAKGVLRRQGRKVLLPGKRDPQAAIEMYCQGRFFTITGNHLPDTPDSIEDSQDAITNLYTTISQLNQKKTPQPQQVKAITRGPEDLTDSALIEKAMAAENGSYFAALWRGDVSGHGSDHSAADMALCNMLAFWTGKDASRMDSLFRQSGLYRDDKWDRAARTGETYGEGTIARAIANCSEVYKGAPSINDIIYGSQRTARDVNFGRDSNNNRHNITEPDAQFVLACMREGEYGDAQLFATLFRGLVLYDHTSGEWYTWAGHWWEEDTTGKIKHLVSGKLASVYIKAGADLLAQASQQEAKAKDGGDDQAKEQAAQHVTKVKGLIKELNVRAFTLRQVSRCKNVLNFASSYDGMGITTKHWDRNPWLLAVPNGVIDLKTGTLRDGKPEDYIRTVCPTEWQGIDTPAPRWERFFVEIFELKKINENTFVQRTEQERSELINFMQRLLGYGATGIVNEHVFAVLYGEDGRNGKDTIQRALSHVLGPASGAISKDVLLDAGRARSSGAPTPHLSDLQGKRLAWASEPEKGARFSIGQVKEYSGGGEIPTRGTYEKKFTKIQPSHLLILLTNHKPHADSNDAAFWERLRLITFDMRYVDNPAGANERKKDTTLWDTLESEASGILAWLVRGCLQWQEQGLNTPESVLLDGKEYRKGEDTLHRYLEERCYIGEGKEVSASRLYEDYATWSKNGNLYVMNSTQFGTQLAKKKFTKKKTNKGYLYYGLGLLDTESERLVNSSSKPFTGTEYASQAVLDGVANTTSEGCEGFQQKSAKNRSHESQKMKVSVLTIHTLHSSSDDSLINEPVEPSQQVVNSFVDHSPDTEVLPDRAENLPTPPTPIQALFQEMRQYIATLPADKNTLFWCDPRGVFNNGYIKTSIFVDRLEAMLTSRDQRQIESAIEVMQKKLGKEESRR